MKFARRGFTLVLIGIVSMSGIAIAQREPNVGITLMSIQWSVKHSSTKTFKTQEIFSLGAGGCLRGPLRFLREDGSAQFSLDLDAEFPTNCGKK